MCGLNPGKATGGNPVKPALLRGNKIKTRGMKLQVSQFKNTFTKVIKRTTKDEGK